MDKQKIKDYITTVALAAIPVIIAYQQQIGSYIPVEYALAFTIIMGVISQLVTNERVKVAYEDTTVAIDQGQAEIQKYVEKINELQAQIDAGQENVEDIMK